MAAQHPTPTASPTPASGSCADHTRRSRTGCSFGSSSKLDAADVAAALNSAFQCGVVCGGDQEAEP